MAQAKTRASAKRSRGSKKPQARSRGSTSRKPQAKSNNKSKSQSTSSKANGVARVDSARRAVEHTAKDAGHAVGRAAGKAKVPLMTGGAALVGAAGGVALGVHQARRHRRGAMMAPRRPQVKVSSRDLAKAAKEVGAFGTQMGQLASELRHNREAANGGQQHRSPLEVVLEGLTARRSRA